MSNALIRSLDAHLAGRKLRLEAALAAGKPVDQLAAFDPDIERGEGDQFDGPSDDLRRIDFLPTPAEIHNACETIRSNWSLNEKRRRFVGDYVPDEIEQGWQPPTIDTSVFRMAAGRVSAEV